MLSYRFKAVLMQLWHLALQGLKQNAIQRWVGAQTPTNIIGSRWAPACWLSKGNGCGFPELRGGLRCTPSPKQAKDAHGVTFSKVVLNLAKWC